MSFRRFENSRNVEVPLGTRTTTPFGPTIDYERAAKPSFSRPMTCEYGLLVLQKFACQIRGYLAKRLENL
jgi:hypothetical protein